ncbi:GATA type zinc finger transcription factor family protein [Artemisia annua]|uniref:GATA type zinc finger transcription factor family protein n=1 Tax=Artemisia annua TaxID=35608 RepID=A0A2U1MV43_ARTAN|nr:GATA type zinc finger transcription factor family protein [Artemisia annua]
MNFTGTQQKCKACGKTVYPVELLSADGIDYHKSCFKCSHCKGTLKLSNYSSMEGVLYCKPHFEQLFKESGNFNKNFTSLSMSDDLLFLIAAKAADSPMLHFKSFYLQTKSPSKAAGMFSGTQDKCATCGKTAYPLEKLSNYSSMEGVLYCKPHFEQLFKESGNFNKNFTSLSMSDDLLFLTAAKAADSPMLHFKSFYLQTKSPSKAAGMFSGTQDKCATCGKTAYPLEKL